MKILHCVKDEKFIDGMVRIYEHDKRHQNRFVNFTNALFEGFNYIKCENVEVLPLSVFLETCLEFDIVILHDFNSIPKKIIPQIPSKCKVIWYGWGYDIYTGYPPIVNIMLYNNETKTFIKKESYKAKIKKHIIKTKEVFYNWLYKEKSLARIDYFSGVFPYEYDLVKKSHKCFKAKQLDFYYGDVNFFIKNKYDRIIERKKMNVIVGNSADISNNHHDALTYLAKMKLPDGARIIIPLSYSGYPRYVNWISDYANKLFPNQVETLQQFLPFNQYHNLISKCRIAIFFHERQQASDNIFMQIMYGAKVYMSETSLAFHYLKSLGLSVFSLQKDWKTMTEDITDEDILKNRRILSELYSADSIIKRVEKINDILEKEVRCV